MLNNKKNIRGESLLIINCNKLIYNNLFISKFYSSSYLLNNKDKVKSDLTNLLKKDFLIKERESGLQMVKFESNSEIVTLLNNESNVSNISESFPWLIDKEGKNIEFTKDIDLFNELVSQYLETRYNVNDVTDVKLTEILKPIFDQKEGEGITVLALYNHVSTLFNKGEFKETILKSITNEVNNERLSDTLESSKPLGNFGDITLNEVVTQFKDLKWDLLINSAKITIHAAPLALDFVGYGLIIRGYMSLVHNRLFPTGLNETQLKIQHTIRNRNLAIFSFLGAPLVLICIRKTALGIKDKSSIEILPNNSNNNLSTNIINKSGIFLMLSNLKNKIPSWVKLILRLIIICIILLNLIGFNSLIDVLSNIFYIKLFAYLTCSLIILHQIFNIYLLHRFISKNIKISPVLPDFIINWLKDLETISLNIENSQYFKNSCYIQILIYLFIIFLISFIL